MTAAADPLDIHIPRSSSGGQKARPAAVKSKSSRSFFAALNSIDMSDRAGLASSELHPAQHRAPQSRHQSFGNIDDDVTPDITPCATLFQRIMSDGIDGIKVVPVRGSSFTLGDSKEEPTPVPRRKQSSFHAPAKQSSFHNPKSSHLKTSPESKRPVLKGASFHSTTSATRSGASAVPAFPLPTSKGRPNSNHPVERRPIEKPSIDDDLPKKEMSFDTLANRESSKPLMQVIDLLWHDLRGVKGNYSGQINTHIQPHGFGSLVLVDGTTITCKWYNGAPLDRRRSDSGHPHREEKNRGSRRSSTGTTDKHHHHKPVVVLDESARTNGSDTNDYRKTMSEPIKAPSSPSTKKLSRKHTYQLGDTPQSNSHMTIAESMKHAIDSADSLKVHDFAFVLRSNGEWCYSIVAQKNSPSDSVDEHGQAVKNYEDANILFVTDTKGSTKCIKMKHWGKMIRLVNV